VNALRNPRAARNVARERDIGLLSHADGAWVVDRHAVWTILKTTFNIVFVTKAAFEEGDEDMKATPFRSSWALVFAAVVMGCGSSDNAKVLQGNDEISETAASQKAVTYVPGTAGAVEKIETADEHRWAVTVSLTGGSEAVVELERVDGSLDEISAEKGPFEYDLPAAAPGLLTYAKARSLAVSAKPGTLDGWELKIPENVWELYTRDQDNKLWEIRLDAKTGATLSTIQKDQKD
jgi:uncharacterized membrane protein YkoI